MRTLLKSSAFFSLFIAATLLLMGMQPERAPVRETNLRGLFGGFRNLPFKLTEKEESLIRTCSGIAQRYFSMRNNKRLFDDVAIRVELEDILQENPNHFYAQHLLGTWHRRNGNADDAAKLLQASLKNAPVVLVRPYRLGDGQPIEGAEISSLSLECNRVQNGSLDPSLSLKYVGLIVDAQGEVQLPAFDTVFRLSGAYPDGYDIETKNLGWFECSSRVGVLPVVTSWRPYSKPSNFTRTAKDTAVLRDAVGTQTNEIVVESNTWVLGSVARAEADGSFHIADGRGTALKTPVAALPEIQNGAHMDHAIIDLSKPEALRFEITDAEILESRTKIPLNTYQSGAGFTIAEKRRFHAYSMWDTLPDAVDLLLRVHNYPEGSVRTILPAKTGTVEIGNGDTLNISYLARGHHHGWSSADGFFGEAKEVEDTSEIIFRIQGNSENHYSFWVVLQNGRRWDLKTSGWFSASVAGGPDRIQAPLEQIDHFELLTYTEPQWMYFENIRLPKRTTPLDAEVPPLQVRIDGVPTRHASDLYYPMKMSVRSQRGRVYSGISSGANGVSLMEADPKQRKPAELSTIDWRSDGTARYNHEVDFNVQFPGQPPKNMGSRSSVYGVGKWGAAGADCRNVPLENVQSVSIYLMPKSSNE